MVYGLQWTRDDNQNSYEKGNIAVESFCTWQGATIFLGGGGEVA